MSTEKLEKRIEEQQEQIDMLIELANNMTEQFASDQKVIKNHSKTIKSLILDDGTVVINRGYFIEDSESLENGKKLNITAIGGSLIGLSGMILYLNNQRTIDEEITLDELEEFADRTKSNSDLAFIFLTLGGFLIAIDNFN